MISDREAITELLAEYCHLCDDGAFDDLMDRFTDDGTFVFGQREVTGREELLQYFNRTQSPERRGKHLCGNVIIEIEGNKARATSDFAFFARVDGKLAPLVIGRYHDELVVVAGRWRIQRRVATSA